MKKEKKKVKNFNSELEPFAKIYSEMHQNIRNVLDTKTNEELEKLIEYTSEPNQTNCWWATYEVAPIVRLESKFILCSRPDEDKAEGEGDGEKCLNIKFPPVLGQ